MTECLQNKCLNTGDNTFAVKILLGSRCSAFNQYYFMPLSSGFILTVRKFANHYTLKSVLCFCIISAASTLNDANISMNCNSRRKPGRQKIPQASGNCFALVRGEGM